MVQAATSALSALANPEAAFENGYIAMAGYALAVVVITKVAQSALLSLDRAVGDMVNPHDGTPYLCGYKGYIQYSAEAPLTSQICYNYIPKLATVAFALFAAHEAVAGNTGRILAMGVVALTLNYEKGMLSNLKSFVNLKFACQGGEAPRRPVDVVAYRGGGDSGRSAWGSGGDGGF